MNMKASRFFIVAAFSLAAIGQAAAETWTITMWNYDKWRNRKQSFSYAVNYASDGDVLEIQNNLTVTSDVEVYKDITVRSKEGSLYTIRNIGRYYICNIHPGGKLTLSDIVVDCENYERREDLFNLNAMKISGTETNIARMVLQDGATIKNVYLSSLSGNENAAIHVKEGAVLRIGEGALIENCNNQSSPGKGGAICCDYGTIIMTGGTITGCNAKGAGGAIHTDGTRVDAVEVQGVSARGDIYLSGGFITNNTCASGSHGGAIYVGNSGPMIHITGSIVVSNNFSGVGSDAMPDDISTYLLENAYANRLKLTGHSDVNPSGFTTNGIKFTGWVGVRYPLSEEYSDPQNLRFGGQWEYFNGTQEEPRQFFWNGDNRYRGRLEGNALLWSRHLVHELPKDGEKIADLIASGEGSPLYVELDGDYKMEKPVYVPENYVIIVDLQGFEFQCDFHVENDSGRVIIRDSSVMKSGKVSGNRESDSPTAFLLEGGSYHTYPPPEWVSPDRVLISNYCQIHPYMVASLAWETNETARISDLTKTPLANSGDEVRVVAGAEDIFDIAFSAGDWVNMMYTNRSLKVQVLAVAAVSNTVDGSIGEVGERVLLFDSDVGAVDSDNVSAPLFINSNDDPNAMAFGREDFFSWNAMSYGLIKLIHITMEEQGEKYATNKIENAYFRFPEASFSATQRSTGGKLPIYLSDGLLASVFGFGRAKGFSDVGVSRALDGAQDNGLKKWENLVTGTGADELLLCTVTETEGRSRLDIALVNSQKTSPAGTGYSVRYDIRKSTDAGWVRVGEVAESPDFSVPLLDENGASLGASGFYRVTTLILPDDYPAVTNEIPSTNIVGVLEVASPLTNTLAAVPWVKLGTAPGAVDETPVTVSNYVNNAHFETDDALQVADKGHVYKKWSWDKSQRKWSGAITVTRNALFAATPADEHALVRTDSVWVRRGNPQARPFFIVGQYSALPVSLTLAAGSLEAPVCTLVSNPSLKAVRVNDYDWGANPVKGDLIRIPNEKAAPHALTWNGSEWGRIVKKAGSREGEWKNDDLVPSGTGFWYLRCGPAFSVSLPQSVPSSK